MENREAIEWFKKRRNGSPMAGARKMFDTAIAALEKQVPMKPLPQEMDIDGRAITPCGFCCEELPHNSLYDFCPHCGQRILHEKGH